MTKPPRLTMELPPDMLPEDLTLEAVARCAQRVFADKGLGDVTGIVVLKSRVFIGIGGTSARTAHWLRYTKPDSRAWRAVPLGGLSFEDRRQ